MVLRLPSACQPTAWPGWVMQARHRGNLDSTQQLPHRHTIHMLLQLVRAIRHTISVLPATATLAHPTRLFNSKAATGQEQNHYQVLGVEQSAAPAVIKKAFRQKAKALHPDLNSHLGQSDAEAFLRLVAAYEVLSDAEQRRLYDAATDPQLPGMIRRAAAAQQQQAGAAGATGCSTQHDADASLNWRWGMADWARYGPASSPNVPMSATEGSPGSDGGAPLGLRLSVLSALRRHQRDLEVELHAALMTAFLGPRLELRAGELPASFELDERSHPLLTDDLLHLVHGRTLLGAVQLPHTLRLEGGGDSPLKLPHNSSSSTVLQMAPGSSRCEGCNTFRAIWPSSQTSDCQQVNLQQPPLSHTSGTLTECHSWQHMAQQQQQQQQQQAQQDPPPPGGQQQQQQQQEARAGGMRNAGRAAAGQQHLSAEAEATAKAADYDAEITDSEWRELLQQHHPLLGAYDWSTDPDAAASSSGAEAQGQQQQQEQGEHVVDSAPGGHLTAGPGEGEAGSLPHIEYGDSQQQQQQDDMGNMGSATAAVSEGGFGGRAARMAWEQKNEVLVEAVDAVGELRPPVDAPRLSEEDQAFIAEYERSMGLDSSQQQQQWSWQQQWNQLDPAGQVEMQQQWQQQWREQQEQWQQKKQQWEDMQQIGQQLSQQHEQQEPHQQPHSHQQQQQQQPYEQQHEAPRRPRSGHRRLWRWLRSPSPDWRAADWSFSDESEGVLVLRLVREGAVAAVGVRDESQPNKPIKVYVDGVLYAALLEDVVMQPMTGKLMAVLYRFYTPGVHHCYFYLPNTPGASRVLAKMLRRWMPPSATWLFPPRSDAHDRCSWLLEWEGFGTQHRPGWLHPAVYVLTSAYYSYDIEARRLSGTSGALQEWWDRAAWAVTWAWSACRELRNRIELVVGR